MLINELHILIMTYVFLWVLYQIIDIVLHVFFGYIIGLLIYELLNDLYYLIYDQYISNDSKNKIIEITLYSIVFSSFIDDFVTSINKLHAFFLQKK